MSRKVSSTFCKSKQIPRIFQRRSHQAVRSVVKVNAAPPEVLSVNCHSIANVQTISGSNFNFDPCGDENKVDGDFEKRQQPENVIFTSADNYSTKTFNPTSASLEQISAVGSRIDPLSDVEKNTGSTETVDDIEKWLKTRTESVSSIDLDTMKSVVEEEEDRRPGAEVGVDRYLADELPHAFLCKDPDGLSIDIDLSDKKLSLDYDPLLRELQNEKLLEDCEKNDDFILPEFRLDHLDPLVLSPRDMMVAGEILPSADHRPPGLSAGVGRTPISPKNKPEGENEDSVNSENDELIDKPIQVDYRLTEELERIEEETEEDNESREKNVRTTTEDENPSKEKNKVEPRLIKKRRKIRPKTDRNEITFFGEPCHIDGKDSVMAVVAISTDKISNMTQIVINTGMDEQIYQGKTSELIEATGNFPKISKIDIDAGQYGTRDRPHEKMVTKALEELGITDESLEPALVNENGRLWLCPKDECNREFCKLHALKTHLLAHFGVRPFKCDYEGCTWAFHSEFKLKRHKETHLKRKNFVCEVAGCNRRFTTIYNLWSHEKLHTRPNRILCQVPDCDEKFQTKRALELHMKNHDQSHAPYCCNHEGCGKRYYTSNALTSHQRCHNYKEVDVKCSWPGCGKIFDKPCRLKAHVRSHTGSKPYSCTFQDCQWAFSSSSKLKRHQKKHTNERKFVCNVEACGKAFMRSEHLKEHLLTHAGGGYFQCYMCDAHFSAKSSLYVHIKKHQVKDAVDAITDNVGNVSKRKIRQAQSNAKKSTTPARIEKFQSNSSSQENDSTTENSENLTAGISATVSQKVVKKEREIFTYNCGMDGCGKSYTTLSNLASHMIETHGSSMVEEDESPIGISGVSEASDLDYILYATPNSNATGACRAMMLESCDAIIMSETSKNEASLPEPEPPPSASSSIEENSRLSDSFYRPTSGRKQISDNQPRPGKTCHGSARTGLTCQDVWKLKSTANGTETINVGATDVVLGEANLNEGLLLTEELPSMYYQDDIVGTECQILLLDTGASENPIDLRGLE